MEYAVSCSIVLKEFPVPERVEAAVDAGFKVAELWWLWDAVAPECEDIDAFVAPIRDAGVQLIGLNFSAGDMPGGEHGLVSLLSHVDDFRVNVPIAVEIGYELGYRTFSTLYGLRQENIGAVMQDAVTVDSLEFATRATAEIGATVLVEPVSDVAGYPSETAAQTLAVVEKFKAERGVKSIGLLCDLYHLATNGDDVATVAADDGGVTAHCQIVGLLGRGESGTGDLDVAGLSASIKEVEYDDWVMLEYVPTVATADPSGNLPELS